ncbi:MAG: DNA-protecting protein DprA [Muribaculaceae bacterium]|nr:DNA-protecting protein DprA [Muribaculaceae bacterium]
MENKYGFGENPPYSLYKNEYGKWELVDGTCNMKHIVTEIQKGDDRFPSSLLAIGEDCPDVIYCIGNNSLLKLSNMVAIIGARAADDDGLGIARYLGIKHSTNVIISGLARRIDTEAHWGCIDAEGKTIAIVGTGLDRVHPKENETLQQKILETGGLIVSEQPLGIKASPRTLIARTRLQMALADTVIVVQCEKES